MLRIFDDQIRYSLTYSNGPERSIRGAFFEPQNGAPHDAARRRSACAGMAPWGVTNARRMQYKLQVCQNLVEETPMQREQLIEQLGQEDIPEETRKAILAARATTLSLLQDLVTDESLAGPEDPGEGWVPVQSVRLLCAMGDTTAIETLIELLAVVPDDSELGHCIMEELPTLGAMIVDPGHRCHRSRQGHRR